MLVGFLTTLLFLNGILLILIILLQKSKGSMGIGALGGGTQMLFGGSGGQDLFQKITWTMGAIFMGGSLVLAILKSHEVGGGSLLNRTSHRTRTQQSAPVNAGQQKLPVQTPAPAPTAETPAPQQNP